MRFLSAYIPMDRRNALVNKERLPDRTFGTTLFADLSGFTPLTEIYLNSLGSRRGADELTRQLNRVYDALVSQIHRYQGCVINFGGDAITCWFDKDEGLRATACGLAMQQIMELFRSIETPDGNTVSLNLKVAVAAGSVRRFLVGDPQIHYLDVIAGRTLDRVADAEHQAQKGEVILSPEVADHLAGQLHVVEWRGEESPYIRTARYAVVSGLKTDFPPDSLPNINGWSEKRALSEEQVKPWLLPPVYERLREAGQEQFLAEIRPAVVLFLRFSGLDYDLDEQAESKLDAYIRWVQRILARHDSYVMQLLVGDKGSYLYTIFGAPVAHDNDAARAVSAALELQALPSELFFIKGVQIGISRGRLRTGAYGGSARLTYGVLGDGVNIAARLMSQAPPGRIMVSQPIVEATAQYYHFKKLGPLKIKGKQEPISVAIAVGKRLSTTKRAFTSFTTPLIGRRNSLVQLEKLLEATLIGREQVIRLEGATGIGKSHLTAEFAELATQQGLRTAVGVCQITSQDTIYHPWQQILRDLFELPMLPTRLLNLDDPDALKRQREERFKLQIEHLQQQVQRMNPNWLLRLPLLGDMLNLPIPDTPTTANFDSKLRQDSLFDLVEELLKYWAQRRPLLLIIEDGHWIDEGSRELLLSLTRLQKDYPILYLLVQRPAPTEKQRLLAELNRLPHYHHLTINELSTPEVTALVEYLLAGPIDQLALDLIKAQGHGNPFFTHEFVNALRSSGKLAQQENGIWWLAPSMFDLLQQGNCLVKQNGTWQLLEHAPLATIDLGIPDSIHSLVLSRFDRLPEHSKVTLKVASVIGRVFEFDVLSQAHPSRPKSDYLRQQTHLLEKQDFIQPETPHSDMAYMFKHNITRKVTYETLLEQQERTLHRAIAIALEQLYPEAIERLAYHFSRSGWREKTLFYLEKAARKAQQEQANETALRYYNQALALEERWTCRKGQAEILHILGQREAEKEALDILAANPAMPPLEMAILWGQYYEAISDYPQAQERIEQVLESTPQAQQAVYDQSRCLSLLGLVAYRQGDYEEAQKRYNQALNMLEGRTEFSTKELQIVVKTLNGLGVIFRQQGDFDKAKTYYEDALNLSRDNEDLPGEAETLNNLGVTAYYQRDFNKALAYHEQAYHIRRDIGYRAGEGASLYNLALATQDAGDYGASEKYLHEALAIQRAIGNRWQQVNVLMGLGILYQELGVLERAENFLQQGMHIAKEIGDEVGVAYLLANLGLVERDRGSYIQAKKIFTEGLNLARQYEENHLASNFLNYLSEICLNLQDFEQAILYANESLEIREKKNVRLATTDNFAILAAVCLKQENYVQAIEYGQQTLQLLTECGGDGPEFPFQDYFICYQVFDRQGVLKEANKILQTAYKMLMERANKITNEKLRQSFLKCVPINKKLITAYKKAHELSR